jgi:DNA polymerase-3 subunit alpha
MHGAVRCILWPEQFAEQGEMVQADAVLMVRGCADRRGGEEVNLIVNELIPFDQLDNRYTVAVKVTVDECRHGLEMLSKVKEVVRFYPGDRELRLALALDDGTQVHVKSHNLRVDVSDEMRLRLDDLLGPGCFQFVSAPPKAGGGNGRKGNGKWRGS